MNDPEDDRALAISAALGNLVRELLEASRRVPPDQLPLIAEHIATPLGARRLRVWLADYPLRLLVPFPASSATPLAIDGTVGGRAFVRGHPVEISSKDGTVLWLPLSDGVDRLGVLEVVLERNDSARVALEHYVHAVAAELVTRGQYTDAFKRARRRENMTLAAELQWQLLPPTTFATSEVTLSGALEPAYEVGGDSFDYAYDNGTLRLLIIDAVGHDLESSFIAALTIGTYRHARRNGADMLATVAEIDAVIEQRFEGSMFVTAQIAEFDTATGILTWVNAGHPNPLLVRQARVIAELDGSRRVPLGLGNVWPTKAAVAQSHLEPEDQLLFYSDGVVEARTASGEAFGVERLREYLERSAATNLPPAEVTRRLSHAVLDHHGGLLQDDATTMLLHWHPDGRPN